ncbi:Hsp20/alpha crystallin family protein [Mycobacterium sp.]|uniref:Hsp20/alpha crystallin family protein n=1 Tax=Mycobacterium sp. TaxID=1785 RepID=UPI0012898A2D|nr:Hsp20/alpha crystallin family protein [Mycobacterium sp.]KAA8954323.1 MAG: Hsp20/alpha crystallin family protein [Mycobacterium sp.]
MLASFTWQVPGDGAFPAVLPMDARFEDDRLVVELDVPGATADSLDVTVEGNALTVRAERRQPDFGPAAVVSERRYGVFTRQLVLGAHVDVDHIKADYSDGVLRLVIPVARSVKRHKVAITTGMERPKAVA